MKNFASILFRTFSAILVILVNERAYGANCAPPSAGAENNCTGAITLTVNGAPITGTTAGATLETCEPTPSCGSINSSVWYSFAATATDMKVEINKTCGTCAGIAAVYTGSCVPQPEFGCKGSISSSTNPNVINLNGLTVSSVYYIQVGYASGGPCADGMAYDITVKTPGSTPSCTGNDVCTGACKVLLNNICYPSSLNGAVDNWSSIMGCQSGNNPEVWFTAKPTKNQLDFTINNVSAGFANVELIVVSATGSCSGLVVAGSSCGPTPLSYSLEVVPGSIYYWTVSSSNGANGVNTTFNICVNEVYSPTTTCTNNGSCLCKDACIIRDTDWGVCKNSSLNGAANCLGKNGCMTATNPNAAFAGYPTSSILYVSVNNLGCGFDGNVEVTLWQGDACDALTFTGSSCGAAPLNASFTICPNKRYFWFVSSSVGSSGVGSTFGIVAGDGSPPTPCGNGGCSTPKYRSVASGGWDLFATWQQSDDGGSTWVPASGFPDNSACAVQIQSPNIVAITTTKTIHGVTIDAGGELRYENGTLTINACSGTDLVINGTFVDSGEASIVWNTGATWRFGSAGTLIRARGTTSSNSWMDTYEGGVCANIPATAKWIVRYTGAGNVAITSTNYGKNCYPNLIIESNSGSWNTIGVSSSNFNGTAETPRIKGNLDIGGTGTGAVIFEDTNNYTSPVLVEGNLFVRSGSRLYLDGKGVEIRGNLQVNGTLDYGTVGSNSNQRMLRFTDGGVLADTISGSGILSTFNMHLSKSTDSMTLNRNITINDTLNLTSGTLFMNTFDITLDVMLPAALVRTGGYVLCESASALFTWAGTSTGAGSYEFPFGFKGEYIPFTFAKDAADPAADLTVSTWTTSVDNQLNIPSGTTLSPAKGTSNFVDRWWEITPSVVFTADLTFRWHSSEDLAISDARSYHWNGTNWDEWVATSFSDTENWLTCPWTSYSEGGGGGNSPLPIKLLYFNATADQENESVNLAWSTATETNNDYFTVERSQIPPGPPEGGVGAASSEGWDIVVKVPGAGNSTQTLYYTAIDKDPYYGLSYYRLKQTDYDGKYDYSEIVVVKLLPKINFSVRPNPATDLLEITFGKVDKNTLFVLTPEYGAHLNIYNTRGKQVYEKQFNSNFYKINIDVSDFSNGMYFVTLITADQLYKAKFVKE